MRGHVPRSRCPALNGEDRRHLVQFNPKPQLEAVFGRYPRLDDGAARCSVCATTNRPRRSFAVPSENSTWARRHELS